MNTYKKLAELRDETKFILKMKKKELEKMKGGENEPLNLPVVFALKQLEELFALYEIK